MFHQVCDADCCGSAHACCAHNQCSNILFHPIFYKVQAWINFSLNIQFVIRSILQIHLQYSNSKIMERKVFYCIVYLQNLTNIRFFHSVYLHHGSLWSNKQTRDNLLEIVVNRIFLQLFTDVLERFEFLHF